MKFEKRSEMQRVVLFIVISWLSVASYGQTSLHSFCNKSSLLKEVKNDSLEESLDAGSSLLSLPRIEVRFTEPDSLGVLPGDLLWSPLGRNHFRLIHTIKTGVVHFFHFNRKLILNGLGLNSQRRERFSDFPLQPYRLCCSEGLLLESLNQQPYHSTFSFHEAEEDKSALPVLRLFGRNLDFDLDAGNNKLLSKLYNPYRTTFRRTLQDGFLFTIYFK